MGPPGSPVALRPRGAKSLLRQTSRSSDPRGRLHGPHRQQLQGEIWHPQTSFKYNEKESTPASLGLCGASRMVTTITTIESPPWRPDLTATPPTILQVALDGKTHQLGKYINMHRQDLATINQKDVFFTSCLHNESKLLLDFHFGTEFST